MQSGATAVALLFVVAGSHAVVVVTDEKMQPLAAADSQNALGNADPPHEAAADLSAAIVVVDVAPLVDVGSSVEPDA